MSQGNSHISEIDIQNGKLKEQLYQSPEAEPDEFKNEPELLGIQFPLCQLQYSWFIALFIYEVKLFKSFLRHDVTTYYCSSFNLNFPLVTENIFT